MPYFKVRFVVSSQLHSTSRVIRSAMLYTIQSAQTNQYVSFSGSHKAGTPVTTEYYLSVNSSLYPHACSADCNEYFHICPAPGRPVTFAKVQSPTSLFASPGLVCPLFHAMIEAEAPNSQRTRRAQKSSYGATTSMFGRSSRTVRVTSKLQ